MSLGRYYSHNFSPNWPRNLRYNFNKAPHALLLSFRFFKITSPLAQNSSIIPLVKMMPFFPFLLCVSFNHFLVDVNATELDNFHSGQTELHFALIQPAEPFPFEISYLLLLSRCKDTQIIEWKKSTATYRRKDAEERHTCSPGQVPDHTDEVHSAKPMWGSWILYRKVRQGNFFPIAWTHCYVQEEWPD